MDPFTQGLLGAAIGQSGFRQRLGRAAIVAGGVLAMTPDVDLFASMLSGAGPLEASLQHRGITHSVPFALVMGPVAGYLLWLAHRRLAPSATRQDMAAWMGLGLLALLSHGLLDAMTSYGTQLLAPFSNRRFAVDAVAVIDPFYTLPLLAAVLYGLLPRVSQLRAMAAGGIALLLTTAYLGYAAWLNEAARELAEEQLADAGTREAKVAAYPTMFQPFLRRLVVHSYPEMRVGYVTMWKPGPIDWARFEPVEHPVLVQLGMTRQAFGFYWFAMGQTHGTLRRGEDGTLIAEMHDMRYGVPGQPQRGMWALRAVTRHGDLVGEIEKVFYRPGWSVGLVTQIFQDAFALPGAGDLQPYAAAREDGTGS
ncbi:MAG: metal-dependent hydrolase [Acetobacterales bacterium]